MGVLKHGRLSTIFDYLLLLLLTSVFLCAKHLKCSHVVFNDAVDLIA